MRNTEVQFLNSGLDVGFAPARKPSTESSGTRKPATMTTESVGAKLRSSSSGSEGIKTTSGSYILSEAKGAVDEVVRARPSDSKVSRGL